MTTNRTASAEEIARVIVATTLGTSGVPNRSRELCIEAITKAIVSETVLAEGFKAKISELKEKYVHPFTGPVMTGLGVPTYEQLEAERDALKKEVAILDSLRASPTYMIFEDNEKLKIEMDALKVEVEKHKRAIAFTIKEDQEVIVSLTLKLDLAKKWLYRFYENKYENDKLYCNANSSEFKKDWHQIQEIEKENGE